MRQIIFPIFLIFTTAMSAQSWHSTCADEGYIEIEEVGGITRMWVEGAYFNCYGSPTEKWHEFNLYCHESAEFEIYKVLFGDTLEVKIGKELVVVAASSKYKRYGWTYGTSCPNVCITGSADVDCFEEYIEPIAPPAPPPTEFWYNQYGNQLQVFSELGFELIFFDINGIFIFYKQYPAGEAWVDVPPMADFASMIYKTHTGYEILGVSL